MNRGTPNFEDQLRSALAVLEGQSVLDEESAGRLRSALNMRLREFVGSILDSEARIQNSCGREEAESTLQSFLLSFASRVASRERLHVFTTNYDRLIEHGCDLAGVRLVDRFVGALTPIFRSSRVEVDYHYNPPGIRGEPRYIEGVVRLTKLHGSLDWVFDKNDGRIRRVGLPFGAAPDHTEVPAEPIDAAIIYPNAAKDRETTHYPYAELFRDFSAAVCRPNAVVVTYGYGFGDDHINRVLLDMLTIPSTHLVIVARTATDRLRAFCSLTIDAQVTLLIGKHFSDISLLTRHYLPKPSFDVISGRVAELLKRRPEVTVASGSVDDDSLSENQTPF